MIALGAGCACRLRRLGTPLRRFADWARRRFADWARRHLELAISGIVVESVLTSCRHFWARMRTRVGLYRVRVRVRVRLRLRLRLAVFRTRQWG